MNNEGRMSAESFVGNEFVTLKPPLKPALQLAEAGVSNAVHIVPVQTVAAQEVIPVKLDHKVTKTFYQKALDLLHQYSLATFAILILAIALVCQPIAARYLSNVDLSKTAVAATDHSKTIAGLNLGVNASQLQSWLQTFTNQPATLNLGTQSVAISPDTIKSWLQISANAKKTEYNIHIKSAAMSSSLLTLANSYTKSAVNQVTITRDDGTSEVAIAGQNGLKLSDPSSINTQSIQLAKNIFKGNGFNINAPLVSVPSQNNTAANFSKLLVADINSKKMWAYENGQLVKTFLVSAGAPATPTPIGEFHVYAKYAVQTMTGFNVNGTPYVQPNVEWVNYFTGGDAVHGVYWHPLSWFGVHNSSHGCIGIPDDQAEWVYDWAPIGTTVITTPN